MKEKSLIKNYIFNLIYNLINILFPIITASYVSRILYAEGVGKIAFASNIVSYFLIISQLGIPRYGTREVAKNRDSKSKLSQIFFEIFTINFISTTCMLFIYYLIINCISYFSSEVKLMNVYGLMLIFNLINVDWFYNGLEEYKYITIRSMIVKMISLILLFTFVKAKSDYIIYGIILCCSTGVNYIFNIIHIRKFIEKKKIKLLNLKKHLKSIFILFSMTLAVELYTQLDTTMLGFMCGDEIVGYYANPMKMIKMIIVTITSLSTTLLPRLSWYYKEKKLDKIEEIVNFALDFIILISIPACIGIIVVSKPLILTLFGYGFENSITTINILALLIPIISIGNLFGTQILMIFNKEKKLLISVIIGAVVNIILNMILIPKFNQNGASIASVIAELIVMIFQIIFARECVKINVNIKNYILIFIGSMSICISNFASYIINNMFFLLVVQIFVGIVLYIIFEFIVKNEIILKIWRYIKEKMNFKKYSNLKEK